eukprot:CAMPEP_0177501828 /NCGR_PEP_ID=MMETSP0369-20130122/37443_1 /TAXON_ID=447022 ORGANISM="Scrippsiella hangoei-like, Strain SHHI-4" /NCGR_SAMPLE_ID=MMETSP0369 /ASSEMBLY_ACC=CAM_ASM_000364 /LENGTH=169 /DNA_ID=CAMNT_0018979381 /DNA_START=48 /DNA_END=552 /DNA_ORIENTATION=+
MTYPNSGDLQARAYKVEESTLTSASVVKCDGSRRKLASQFDSGSTKASVGAAGLRAFELDLRCEHACMEALKALCKASAGGRCLQLTEANLVSHNLLSESWLDLTEVPIALAPAAAADAAPQDASAGMRLTENVMLRHDMLDAAPAALTSSDLIHSLLTLGRELHVANT